MALFGRIQICNLLSKSNVIKNKDSRWMPYYRDVVLNFGGQSGIIQLANGGGKTTISEGILALLSYDSEFILNTVSKMAPYRPDLPPSHVRIELIIPTDAKRPESEFIFDDIDRPRGETYVLGMYGYCNSSNNSRINREKVHFYAYQGRFEDVPLSLKREDGLEILSNQVFLESLKKANRLQHKVSASAWRDLLIDTLKFPQRQLEQLVKYQKQGGGDKSAQIFRIGRKRPGETFHAAFFYTHVAPEIMAGLISDDGPYERTILYSSRKLIENQIRSEKHKQRMDEMSLSLDKMEGLVSLAKTLEDTQQEVRSAEMTIGYAASSYSLLIENGGIPGIPKWSPHEDEKVNRLFLYMGMEPGGEIVLRDKGIGELIGSESKRINQFADRSHISNYEKHQLIDITCDLAFNSSFGQTDIRGNHPGKVYKINQARKLLSTISDEYFTGIRSNHIKAAKEAFEHFASIFVAPNPVRKAMSSIKIELESSIAHENELERMREEVEQSIQKQEDIRKQYSRSREAYDAMVRSELFSPDELNAPLAAKMSLEDSLKSFKKAKEECSDRISKLSSNKAHGKAFIEKYGIDADPIKVKADLDAKLSSLDSQKKQLEQSLIKHRAQVKDKTREVKQITEKIDKYRDQHVIMEERSRIYKRFLEMFPESQSPHDVLASLEKEVSDIHTKKTLLEKDIEDLQKKADLMDQYRKDFGEMSPKALVQAIEQERDEKRDRDKNILQDLDECKKQLKDLESKKVAPGTMARKMIDMLPGDVKKEYLHEFIDRQNLDNQKKELFLSLFSNVLFSPVVGAMKEADFLLSECAKKDIPIMVFLEQELMGFISNGEISRDAATGIAYTYHAGKKTDVVECILDPTLLEKQKNQVKDRIEHLNDELEAVRERLSEINPDSPKMKLAVKVAELEGEDIEDLQQKARERLSHIRSKEEEINEKFTPEIRSILIRADEYVKKGGDERFGQLLKGMDELKARRNTIENEINSLTDNMEVLDTQLQECNGHIRQIMNEKLGTNFDNASTFISLGGLKTLQTSEEEREEIDHQIGEIEGRLRYQFDLADEYVKNKELDFEIDRILTELQGRIITIKKDIEETNDQTQRLQRSINKLEINLLRYESEIASILDEFKPGLSSFGLLRSSHPAGKDNELSTIVTNLQTDIMNSYYDNAVDRLQEINQFVKALDIRHNVSRINTLRREYDKKHSEYSEKLNRYIQADDHAGLSSTEKSRLQQSKNNPELIFSLYDDLKRLLQSNKEEQEGINKTIGEIREAMITRLMNFAEDAHTNLALLKAVSGRKEGARFFFKANISSRERLLEEIDRIVDEIRHKTQALERDKRKVRKQEEFEEKELLPYIREEIYRAIFSDPSITLRFPAIRGGDEIDLPEENVRNGVSNGEKTAIMLLMLITLSELACEKELYKTYKGGPIKRRSASQYQSFIIIDGLFSDLSSQSIIDDALKNLSRTQGTFQLIGLVHNASYKNNSRIFPVYIVGRGVETHDKAGVDEHWVIFKDMPQYSNLSGKNQESGSVSFFSSYVNIRRDQ